jgi:predicted kinase
VNKLILIAGVPGSGKTTIGKGLSKAKAMFIDKDTISSLFTESLLIALKQDKDDRESEVYSSKVRCLEYNTMMRLALENISLGHDVVCSAPFIAQFNDDEWIRNLELEVKAFGAKLVKVWVQIDENTARERIIERGASRDNGKLSDWDGYIASTAHRQPTNLSNLIVVDNSVTSLLAISDQVLSIESRI